MTVLKSDRSTYLCIVPYYWGRGPSLAAAVRACRRAGGRVREPALYVKVVDTAPAGQELPPLPSVDDYGNLLTYRGAVVTRLDRNGRPQAREGGAS